MPAFCLAKNTVMDYNEKERSRIKRLTDKVGKYEG